MKRVTYTILAALAFVLSMSSCQREELNTEEQTPIATHTVSFTIAQPETKTTMSVDGDVVSYSWDRDDFDRISIFEDGTEGEIDTERSSITDGVMSITAEFEGETSDNEKTYTAFLNAEKSIGTQAIYNGTYDKEADILVAEPITTTAATDIKFKFKREVAFRSCFEFIGKIC